VPALANFLNAERHRRGWSKKDFARAVEPFDISQSTAYLILSGSDNVRRDTLEALAYALGMTPAEMAVAMYDSGHLAAHQVAASTAIEQMPPEKRPIAIEMLWGLTAQTGVPPAQLSSNRGRLDTTNRQQPGVGQSGNNQGEGPKRPRKGSVPRHYPSTRVPFLGAFGRLLTPAPAL
jgi:transcriptional regulator with XRE-family HTH domain